MKTAQEFLVYTIREEIHRFKRVIEAVPGDGMEYTPHEKSQTTAQVLRNFEVEIQMCMQLLETGGVDYETMMQGVKGGSPQAISAAVEAGLNELANKVEAATEEAWEAPGGVEGGGVTWKDTRGNMVWQVFLDLIHHRGQLSTYLRPMGAKVPAIYGPSGDENSSGM